MENRLLKLSIEHPELSEYVDRIKSKQEFLKVLKEYLPGYTEEDFDRDLNDLKTLSEEELSIVAGGVMIPELKTNEDLFKSVTNQVKKMLLAFNL